MLWENNLDSTGFTIKDSAYVKLDYDKIVVQPDTLKNTDQKKYLKYNGIILLSYYSRLATSRIVVKEEYVLFNKRGFFDPLGILWEGEMAKQRIAELPNPHENKAHSSDTECKPKASLKKEPACGRLCCPVPAPSRLRGAQQGFPIRFRFAQAIGINFSPTAQKKNAG